MKIILHGATDCGSSNYGDFLYGKLIYDYLQEIIPNAEIGFYNPSPFFNKYIDINKNNCKFTRPIREASAAIYIPGGYFGEGHNATLKETLVQFIRFIPFGIKCLLLKIPLVIIGVGVGPNKNLLFRKSISKLVRYSNLTTVRDHESFLALNKMGCTDCIELTDLILAFDIKKYDKLEDEKLKKILSSGKKIILVHYNHSSEAADKFGKALRMFMSKNREYYPIVVSDQIISQDIDKRDIFENAYESSNYYYYQYHDPFELGGVISAADFVITSKLHVGVTAAQKYKLVVAVAVHPEKTGRFYKEIGEYDRFMDLERVNPRAIAEKIDKYVDIPINIPVEINNKAKVHLKYLDDFLSKFNLLNEVNNEKKFS